MHWLKDIIKDQILSIFLLCHSQCVDFRFQAFLLICASFLQQLQAQNSIQRPERERNLFSWTFWIIGKLSKVPLQTFPPSSGPGLYYSSSKPFTLRGLELTQLTKINQGIYWALGVAISPEAPNCLRTNWNWGSVKQEGKEWLFSG